jgi:hypothetical protein
VAGPERFARYGGAVPWLTQARPAVLALSDALAILVFTTIGLISHEHGLSAGGYAGTALPLLGCWFAAALVLGLYRRRRAGVLLATWLVGVTAGVLLRALVLGHSVEVDFLAVALVFVLLFVTVLRVAVGSLGALRRPA